MNRIFARIINLLTAFLLIVATFGMSSQAKSEINENTQIYLPILSKGLDYIAPVIPDTTVPLSGDSTDSLAISADGVEYTFAQDSPELQQIDPGDVIVGDVTDSTPDGFLRKVTNVSEQGGQIIITTADATLEDAIQDGCIFTTEDLTPADILSTRLADGVTMIANPDSHLFEYSLDKIFYQTQYGYVKAVGSVTFDTRFDMHLQIRDFSIKYFDFYNTTSQTASLTITSTIAYTQTAEYDIAEHIFGPRTYMVGVVPVVVFPILSVYVGYDGNVHADVSAGVSQSFDMKAGVKYDFRKWTPIWEMPTPEFNFQPPTVSGDFNLKAYGGVQFSLLLYGIAGPYAAVEPYLRLEAVIHKVPWWSLYLGVGGHLGAEVGFLGNGVPIFDSTPVAWEKPLLHANYPPEPPSSPHPANGTTGVILQVDLSWTDSDHENDALTYDVYLEVGDSTPDILVSDDQFETTYDPGILTPNTQYYWKIVARDVHNDITESPIWSFTTGSGLDCPITITITDTVAPYPHTLIVYGSATSVCSTIMDISWDWGDWVTGSQLFPATHDYFGGEMPRRYYTIIATAYGNLGNSATITFTATLGPEFTYMDLVPAGNFQMGCDPLHNGGFACEADELPLRAVYLDDYYIGALEVTNQEYRQCVRIGACTPPVNFSSETRPSYFDNPDYDLYPVIYTDWNQASTYCTWYGGRLPTEAEWEKAARGSSDTRAFPWGDAAPTCHEANFNSCVGDTQVAWGSNSPYGLIDMSGNVWEWASDWYQADYYMNAPSSNPTGPMDGDQKVLRGGGWLEGMDGIRVANRYSDIPQLAHNRIGFRCVDLP